MSQDVHSCAVKSQLRVLCLEDDPVDAELNVLELQKAGYTVESTIASDRESFLGQLASQQFDVIIADYGLPGWNGLDAFKLLQESGRELPFILVTGMLGEETAVECVKQGVWDYVLKQRLVRLPFAVKRALRTHELQSQRQAAEQEREQLLHDMRLRVKELTCISQVMRCVSNGRSLPAMFQQIVDLLPVGWQYPEIACVRLRFDGRTYTTRSFDESTWRMRAPLRVAGADKGELEVFYHAARPQADEGPFVREERTLLDMVARAISEALERRTAHEALRQREAHFRSLIEHGHDLICLSDADGIVRYISPSVQRILGYAPEELVDRNAFDFIARKDRERCRKMFQDALGRPGEVYQSEFSVRHKDGGARIMETIGSNLLHDPDVGAVVMNQRDVTDRCRAEEDLRRSERKYRELFDLANDAILIFEPEGEVILEANARACELYGLPHGRLVGMSLKRLTQDVDRGEHQIADLLQTGSWNNFETVHLRADGAPIALLANAKVIEYGGRTAVLTVNRDISGLKQAQDEVRQARDDLEKRVIERTAQLAEVNAQLRRSRDEWQSTFDCLSEAMTVHDASFRILRCNRAFREMFREADLEHVRCHELLHGLDHPPEECPLARTVLTHRSESCELFEPRLGKYLAVRTDPMFDGDGSLTGIVHTISDISERKEIERMKSDFVATVSHELRTPLTSLRGFVELMLQKDYPAEKRRHFLEVIQRESQRLTDLVNDVLDLQRIESGRQVFRFEPVSIAEIVHEITDVFAGAGPAYTIVEEVPPEVPLVFADTERIRQVISNLVSNALKYSPDGGKVSIGARQGDGEVVMWVSDEGIGIAPELLCKIFSRFYRVDNTATRKIGGTGLGLALVKDIVEAHGGRAWAESTPGGGSTFFFTLKFAQPERETTAA